MQVTNLTKNKHILHAICKFGYFRNGLKLDQFLIRNNGRFYIYKVNDFFVATESFSWYLNKNILAKNVADISCKFYQPKPGDTIVDIGAGLGEEATIYAEQVGPHGRVYAIEANPAVYAILQELVSLSGFSNVYPFNLALSDQKGSIEIIDTDNSYLSSSFSKGVSGKLYNVPSMPLHQFCSEQHIKQIDLLKVNIEGAERFLRDTFIHSDLLIKNVAISCHDFRYVEAQEDFFRTKQLVTDFLTKSGYTLTSQHTGTAHIDDWVYGTKTA